jgi:3-dehydroquinate synthase
VARFVVGDNSEIQIDRGVRPVDILPPRPDREKVAVLSQPGAAEVAERLIEGIGDAEIHSFALPDREAAKTLATAEAVYAWLGRVGIGRHDTIVVIGGGAATDLGGFVAATYLRGVEAIYVPTTLLAAVDAAIGGKTGINLDGKNLVGVFSHPRRVVVDLEVMDSLSEDLRREGMAEAVKAGLIGDPALFAHIEAKGLQASSEMVVSRAVAVKVDVVNDDFRESGRRAILNYGHTIGHAVEVAAGWSHGEAVAVGMVAAGHIAQQLEGFGEAARQERVIERLGLPVRVHNLDRGTVLDLLGRDKKRDHSGMRMVLLRGIGDPVVRPVPADEIGRGLASIGIT